MFSSSSNSGKGMSYASTALSTRSNNGLARQTYGHMSIRSKGQMNQDYDYKYDEYLKDPRQKDYEDNEHTLFHHAKLTKPSDLNRILEELKGFDENEVLHLLASDRGKVRIEEILTFDIDVESDDRKNILGLYSHVRIFLNLISQEMLINSGLRSSVQKIYSTFFKNPSFFLKVIQLIFQMTDETKSSKNRVQSSYSYSVDLIKEILLPVIKLLNNYLSLQGRRVDVTCKHMVRIVNLIYENIKQRKSSESLSHSTKTSKNDEVIEEIVESLNRKLQSRVHIVQNQIKLMEKQGRATHSFLAYRADWNNDANNDRNVHKEKSLELDQTIIPRSESVLEAFKSNEIPKRYRQTFTDVEKMRKYFFDQLRIDSFALFSCIERLMLRDDLFNLDKFGELKLKGHMTITTKVFDELVEPYLDIYGSGTIIRPGVSRHDKNLRFLCSAKLPRDEFRNTKIAFIEAKEYWKKHEEILQPESLLAMIWRNESNEYQAMLVKINLKNEHKNSYHPSVSVDWRYPRRFIFFVSAYNLEDESRLMNLMQIGEESIIFISVRGHFFLGSEVVLRSIVDPCFFSSNTPVEQALLGSRECRLGNPCNKLSYRGKYCNFASVFQPGEKSFRCDLSLVSKSNLYMVLKKRAEEGKLVVDETQAKGLIAALTQSVSLIQGPPGTGKTYLGVQIVKMILDNQDYFGNSPILCICYTNHALDAFLEGLIKAGVPKGKIIRGGNSSKNEDFECMKLSERAKEYRDKSTKRRFAESADELRKIERGFINLSIKLKGYNPLEETVTSFEEVLSFLQRRNMTGHIRALLGRDEDNFKISGFGNPEYKWYDWLKGAQLSSHNYTEFSKDIIQNENVYDYNIQMKEYFISVIVNARIEESIKTIDDDWGQSFESLRAKARFASHFFKEISRDSELLALRNSLVVGFTTSGAAKYRDLLQNLGAKTIICEEAGEVLEPHILASISSKTERLVLIGDHLQLRPKVNLYSLEVESGKGYDLDISLFERLVGEEESYMENGHEKNEEDEFGLITLHTQRRMRPEISSLFRESNLYPNLEDDESVKKYPKVQGMRENLFFYDHKVEESGGGMEVDSKNGLSYSNQYEAVMVISLVQHLIKNEYRGESQIAVLTPYLGQVKLLRDMLKEINIDAEIDETTEDELQNKRAAVNNDGYVSKHSDDNDEVNREIKKKKSIVRLSSIDNFQGEEADIVVISTVRSNQKGRVGFLKVMNRINVMFSRAKHGMYILGNSELSEKSRGKIETSASASTNKSFFLLGEFISILKSRRLIGNYFPLKCGKHPDVQISARTPEDFIKLSPEGGCSKKCGGRFTCGHPCPLYCHPGECPSNTCVRVCERIRKMCTHPCKKPCGIECGECLEKVKRKIPLCGHIDQSMECRYATLSDYELIELYKTTKLKCLKEIELNNDQRSQIFKKCSHRPSLRCWMIASKSDLTKCSEKCGKIYGKCTHYCEATCHEGLSCPSCNKCRRF